MDFSVHQHKLAQLAARFNLMVALVFGLLMTNVLMGSLAWYTGVHQRIEVTPFTGSSSYIKSDSVVDVHYLTLMSENFIYSRLNVTPETVIANHKRLLSYVDAAHYSAFSTLLHKEATLIQDKKISSHIDITGIHADSRNLSCTITGIVKRFVGLRALPDTRATYTVHYRYANGRLAITQFTHTEEKKHA
jgi:conjugal transfer pilus assembly protein TraE